MQFSEDLFRRRIAAGIPATPVPGSAVRQNGSSMALPEGPIDLGSLWTITSNEQFLNEAYRRVLGREADISGFVNYLELLRRHVPRRVIVRQIVNSEEAKRRGVRFTGIPAMVPLRVGQRFLPSVRQIPGQLVSYLREFVRVPLSAQFDTVNHKLDFVLREMALRTDALSAKTDEGLWTVSSKLDRYVGDMQSLQSQTRDMLTRTISESLLKMTRLEAAFGMLADEHRQTQAVLAATQAESGGMVEEFRQLQADNSLRIDALSSELRSLRESVAEAQRQAEEGRRQLAARSRAILAGNHVVATEVDGFILGVPGEEWRMAAYYAFRGAMEQGTVRRFSSLIRPGMVVVDVGANVGIFTLHAAKALAGRGRIYSFEPTPRIFQLLQENVQVNGFLEQGIVRLHEAAVIDHEGTAQLNLFAQNSGHNTLFGSEGGERIAVRTVALDQILEPDANVDVVKIDAEGSEPLVLRGMREAIARSRGIRIILEFAPAHLRRAGVDPGEFLDEIAALGLGVNRIEEESGELAAASREELMSVHSVNLELARKVEQGEGRA